MPDYFAGIVVFGIITVVFLNSWNSIISDQTEFPNEPHVRSQAIHTSTFLVSTPGHPENWEEDGVDVEVPGFAEPDHLLQDYKLEAFKDLSYDKQRKLLQTQNYYMAVKNDTGIIESGGEPLEFGRSYEGAEQIIPITRNVQINNSGNFMEAQLQYVVWQ